MGTVALVVLPMMELDVVRLDTGLVILLIACLVSINWCLRLQHSIVSYKAGFGLVRLIVIQLVDDIEGSLSRLNQTCLPDTLPRFLRVPLEWQSLCPIDTAATELPIDSLEPFITAGRHVVNLQRSPEAFLLCLLQHHS